MKTILKLEEAAKFLGAWWLTAYLGSPWWLFLAWLLAPDLSMVGYLLGPRVGAITYNLVHHQLLAVAVGLAGIVYHLPDLQFAGLLLFGHSAMDRVVGYGLKYPDDFKHTHMGWIGGMPSKTTSGQ